MKYMIPKLKLWKVTYRRPINPEHTRTLTAYVDAINKRFAFWNAQDLIGFAMPGDKVTISPCHTGRR